MADAATTANREVLMANAIAGDKNVDQAGRIEELSKLVQEGWALVRAFCCAISTYMLS